MPKGLLEPSTATAMPVKPNPGENPSMNLPYFPRTSVTPANPASIPLNAITPMVVAAMLMPEEAAAFAFSPTARMLKPMRVERNRKKISTANGDAKIERRGKL